VTPNNRMQRAGHDKVHARHCPAGFSISDYAPKVRRAVADAGRSATIVKAPVLLGVCVVLVSCASAPTLGPNDIAAASEIKGCSQTVQEQIRGGNSDVANMALVALGKKLDEELLSKLGEPVAVPYCWYRPTERNLVLKAPVNCSQLPTEAWFEATDSGWMLLQVQVTPISCSRRR
jgi:hypothetical protein